ncbi:chemotaxis protein CheW [Halobacterium sp. PCN9]|uniref:Chemotaxis protein CheW n=2 Tax=Halobacterium bonnevillei TaxID=2692200 RepID=A0A6B0SND4_9EURY|nr:chemotaxis protein CheW [Halobacterium bonnevillei]
MNLEEADRVTADAAHVVEFELGNEVCAIDIQAVDSIVESKQVTRVPRAPDAVEGVMDLRGETTAIVDPREFLSIDGDLSSDNILVLDRADDKQKIGLRVAEVTEVSSYPEPQVDTGEDVERIGTTAVERDLVKGVIRKLNEELEEDDDIEDADVDLVLWLDIDRLIDAVAAGENGDNQR